ncbi:uncharacterized protein LOC121391570 [Gigantopelta aegis]|uniref:uncharacterized protein LOC121391570 n=1 Tax=Gigantopelta aegis TaxID=1735272 RepID=UPI001B88816D|nr:uncharacterized protein LOC121391570 [Gigantopelta aegis]
MYTARCTDPGTPGGGTQIVDGYEGGQSVSYTCNRTGYTPHPPEALFCIISSNGTANWNGTMPRCKDTTPPQFTNCPTSDISIDSLDVPGFALPVAQDNSKLVVSINVTPENFDPKKPVKNATTVTYTATDGENNSADCVIQIILKNREFPNLTCPDSLKLGINDTVSREVNLTQYITSNSPLSNIPSVTVSFSTYGQTKNYSVSSTNDMNMTSSCAFQVEIAGMFEYI